MFALTNTLEINRHAELRMADLVDYRTSTTLGVPTQVETNSLGSNKVANGSIGANAVGDPPIPVHTAAIAFARHNAVRCRPLIVGPARMDAAFTAPSTQLASTRRVNGPPG